MNDKTATSLWLTAHIKINPVLEEAVVDFLVGVMAGAVEQTVDYEGSDIPLTVYFEEKDMDEKSRLKLQNKVEKQLSILAEIFQVNEPEISWIRIEDQDWSSNWKEHFKPFTITKGLTIVPTWEEYQPKDDEQVITMDPGMAFGTGHHATTSLSLDLLRQIIVNNDKKNLSVLDVGCGTGILGMGAALFGATKVLGIDNDPEAVRVATENVELNACDSVMEISLTPLTQLTQSFDCIVANIIHDVLISMISDFQRLVTLNGSLVLSGILHGKQEKNIIQRFEQYGFTLIKNKKKEEWVALYFSKNSK